MPLQLSTYSHTVETWAGLIGNPEDRREVAQSYFESVGGKLYGLRLATRRAFWSRRDRCQGPANGPHCFWPARAGCSCRPDHGAFRRSGFTWHEVIASECDRADPSRQA